MWKHMKMISVFCLGFFWKMLSVDTGDLWCWEHLWARKRTMMWGQVQKLLGFSGELMGFIRGLSICDKTVFVALRKRRGFSMAKEAFGWIWGYTTPPFYLDCDKGTYFWRQTLSNLPDPVYFPLPQPRFRKETSGKSVWVTRNLYIFWKEALFS